MILVYLAIGAVLFALALIVCGNLFCSVFDGWN